MKRPARNKQTKKFTTEHKSETKKRDSAFFLSFFLLPPFIFLDGKKKQNTLSSRVLLHDVQMPGSERKAEFTVVGGIFFLYHTSNGDIFDLGLGWGRGAGTRVAPRKMLDPRVLRLLVVGVVGGGFVQYERGQSNTLGLRQN